MRLLDLVLDGIIFLLYIKGPVSVVQLCTCCTVVEMQCFCWEYVDFNKYSLQLCLCRYVFVANEVYCHEANSATQNFKLLFPVFG